MAKQESKQSNFGRAHDAFESMDMRDRSVFLVEATASTLIRGIQKTSDVLADELGDWFHRAEKAGEPSGDAGPASGASSGAKGASSGTATGSKKASSSASARKKGTSGKTASRAKSSGSKKSGSKSSGTKGSDTKK